MLLCQFWSNGYKFCNYFLHVSNMNHFIVNNNYRALEEDNTAINSIIEDDDGMEYNFKIISPKFIVITEEKEGYDNDITPSSLLIDVPGYNEVFFRHNSSLSDSVTINCSLSKGQQWVIRYLINQPRTLTEPCYYYMYRSVKLETIT